MSIEGELVLIKDKSITIKGTAERLYGVAYMTFGGLDASGKPTVDYQGGTEVDWNGSETITDERRERMFVTENDDEVPESEVGVLLEDGRLIPLIEATNEK